MPYCLSKTTFGEIKRLVVIALCMLVNTICWNLFLFPHNVTGGGGTGVATVLMYATRGLLPENVCHFFDTLGMASVGGGIPVSLTLFLFNGILLAFALKILGWKFCVRTIYGVLVLTGWFWIDWRALFARYIGTPPEFDPFMSVIIAGLISGTMMGIIFSNNGSTGGTDILAKIINKYRPISLGKALLICDFVIICSSGFTPEGHLENVVYGLIFMVVQSFAVDLYINGLRQSVQFFIFSSKPDEVADAIARQAHRGVTLLDGMGWYSQKPSKVITVLARRNESNRIFKIIKQVDDSAFISQTAAIGVYGEGFEHI
ncbi:MAG: YitT family protein [Candidatus Aphodosoma sp.]